VDGTTYPTAVTGTLGAVLDGTPLTLTGCGPAVSLSAGSHRVVVRATEQYTATRLTLRPRNEPVAGPVTYRDVRVRDWTTSRRDVEVGAGAAALLIVPENVNDGWRATLDGDPLTAVRVDGWKQGYLVPAGDGGRVTLQFAPNRWYQAGLLLGAALALLLLAGAVLAARRERARARMVAEPDSAAAGSTSPSSLGRDRPWPWAARIGGLLVVGVLGGPAFAAGLVVGDLGRRRIGDPGATGAVLVGVAGVAAAIAASQQAGLPPVWCDALAAAGMGLVAAGLLTRPPARDGRHGDG
jgi:arabinofuranan 3-O-arabinosyltransferase